MGSTAIRSNAKGLNLKLAKGYRGSPRLFNAKPTPEFNSVSADLPIRRRFLRRLARRNRAFRPINGRSKQSLFAPAATAVFRSPVKSTSQTGLYAASRSIRKTNAIARLHRLHNKNRTDEAPSQLVAAATNQTRGSVTHAVSSAAGTSSPIRLTALLSLVTGRQVHLTRLPALALARYALDRNTRAQASESARTSSERRDRARGLLRSPQSAVSSLAPFTDKLSANVGARRSSGSTSAGVSSAALLGQLAQERGGRFQYAAVLLPDLLRLTFLAVYLKKAAFLAELLAFALGQLPRNRKETQFLRILRKVVKVLVAARPERLGVRIRVVGRVNR